MSEIDNRRRWLRGILIVLVGGVGMVKMGGCATAKAAEKIYHGFSLEVGKNLPAIKNVRYSYGDLGWEEAKVAAPPAAFSTVRGVMTVPEEFEISWESESGQRYALKVPVRSRIKTDLKGKTVKFVIKEDRVEGYVATPLPNFRDQLDQFY